MRSRMSALLKIYGICTRIIRDTLLACSPAPSGIYSKISLMDTTAAKGKRKTDEYTEDARMDKRIRSSASAPETIAMSREDEIPVEIKPGQSSQMQEPKRKRRRERPSRIRQPREDPKDADGNLLPKTRRYPKRQCALMLGFCGSGYSGMQIQPDVRTIEGVLFGALVKIGAISQDNADDATKVSLARAARTDAGVHAAGNVVSLKMIVTIPGVGDIVARANEELPPEIRLWDYVRTQNSFNARLICDSRKYTYFFPTYLLIPPKPGSGLFRSWLTTGVVPDSLPSFSFWVNNATHTNEEDLVRKRAWRASTEQVEMLRNFATKYEGTHNFHNFTVGREVGDRSNMRYMKKIEVADPFVYGDTEWMSVLFHGQSFMLHQIRKMMSGLVLGIRMGTPATVLNQLYGKHSVFVPKMPALGLLLEEPLFESYNQRMAVINEGFKPTDPDYRPRIDFSQYRDRMKAFKEQFIYKNMREVEDRDGLFDAWIRSIDDYAGNDLLYLNPTGTLPDSAIIKIGSRRENPFKERRVFDTTSFSNRSKIVSEEDEVDEEAVAKENLEETEG